YFMLHTIFDKLASLMAAESRGSPSPEELETHSSLPTIMTSSAANPDVSLLDLEDLKIQLKEVFASIDSSTVGSFSAAFPLPQASNPGLSVDGLGEVGLPLTKRDAKELIKICHKAPFSKGSNTIVDEAVRKTWELNPDQFKLCNNAIWDECIVGALATATVALGIGSNAGVRAELYKMLLYEDGAHFEKHRDTEKTRGMFGTMVIALPSEHSGGEVETIFGDQSRVLHTAKASQFDYTALAWYSDVEHTVKPITSGYRLVLTYNLVHTAFGAPPLAAAIDDSNLKLSRILGHWGRQPRDVESEPEKLVYILGHKYTDANLRLSHLKGRDRAKADQLYAVCKDTGFCLLLANLERQRFGACEDDPGDRWNLWKYLSRGNHREMGVETDSSSPLAKDITLDEEDIIQSNSFKRAPDSEDYEGYTGNEGTSTTHYYRNSCLMIMPKEDIAKFLVNASITKTDNLQPALEGLINQVRRSTDNEANKTELARVCRYIIEKQKTTKLYVSDENFGVLANAALAIRQPSIFESAAGSTIHMMPIEVLKELGEMIAQKGLGIWQAAFDAATDSPKKMHKRLTALRIIEDGFKLHIHEDLPAASDLHQLESLIRAKVESMLSSEADVGPEAAALLLDRVQSYGESFLAQRLLPFVKSHGAKPQFWVLFLNQLFQVGQKGCYQPSLVADAFRDALDGLLPNLQDAWGPFPATTAELTGSELAALICNCVSQGLKSSSEMLINKLVDLADTVDPSIFGLTLLPMLINLLKISPNKDISLRNPSFQALFQQTLDRYLCRYVLYKPEEPRDLKKDPRGCGCKDCNELDVFLANPTKQTWHFKAVEYRRSTSKETSCVVAIFA
ncbi:MAG: hypothetical protein Q9214_003247, partial [Letrouitia sp. 1 TL-2023]